MFLRLRERLQSYSWRELLGAFVVAFAVGGFVVVASPGCGSEEDVVLEPAFEIFPLRLDVFSD